MPSEPTPPNRRLVVVQAVLALVTALLAVAWFVPLRNSGLDVTYTGEGAVLRTPDGTTVELEEGMVVRPGDRVSVPPGGAVNLKVPDGHDVTVTDSSEISIEESSSSLIGGKLKNRVDVEGGAVRVTGEGGARTSLDIGLPYGIAGVRGTEFDVRVQGDAAQVSVHDGAVALGTPEGVSLTLEAGQGAVVTEAGAEVRDLPGMPQLVSPGAGAVVSDPGDALVWAPVPGAAQYEVQLALDEGFHQPLLRAAVSDTVWPFPTLEEDSPVFVRVVAVSADGLRSAPTGALPVEIRLRLGLGLQNLATGNPEASIRELTAALPNYPNDPTVLKELAWSYFLLGRHAEARDVYLRALAAAPEDTEVRLELARVHTLLEEGDDAEALYRGVLEENPDDADALWGLGDLRRRQGRAEEAVELFRRALEIDPDHPYARVSLRAVGGV